MSTYEKYSFLMSVYDKEKPEYLRDSIASMLNQTVMPDQIVIVEDGPLNNELRKVISDFTDRESMFTIVALSEQSGLGKALDFGLEYCRNDLVARMDSDDISLPERCKMQLEIFTREPKLSICSGTIGEFVGEAQNIVSYRKVPENQSDIVKQMRTRSAFNHPAVMYRKSEVIRCGGYGTLPRKQDHDLFSRMMNMGCKAYNIQQPVLLFRADENNLQRRKSWKNCKCYIIAQWRVLRRGHCGVGDFLFVLMAQLFFLLSPKTVIKFVNNKFLRS